MNDKNPKSVSRQEFRNVLTKVVDCLRTNLDIPGVSPFNPTEIAEWLNQVTADDVEAVWNKQTRAEIKARIAMLKQRQFELQQQFTRATAAGLNAPDVEVALITLAT